MKEYIRNIKNYIEGGRKGVKMYIKELDDMLLKDKIERELAKIGYLVDLDKVEEIINDDRKYIKEYEEETQEMVSEIKDKKLECFRDIPDIVRYKEIVVSLFEHILNDNKKYIKARKKTNEYFSFLVKEIRRSLKE